MFAKQREQGIFKEQTPPGSPRQSPAGVLFHAHGQQRSAPRAE